MSRAGAQPFLEKLVTISSENLAHATGALVPQQAHLDTAALVHGTEIRVLQKSDVERMCAVVAEAGRRIGGGQLRPELMQRVTQVQNQIRHRVMLRRPAYGLMWRTARMIRGRLSRLKQAIQ
jgi:hypothetical protein